MELHGYQDPVRCRAFAITLKGPALAWFNRLPPSLISSFRELSIAFVFYFIGARTYRKPSYHLLTIKQSSQESLRSYVQRFNAESVGPLSRTNPFWRIRIESEMPCYHSITQNPIFAEAILKFRQAHKHFTFNKIHLQ